MFLGNEDFVIEIVNNIISSASIDIDILKNTYNIIADSNDTKAYENFRTKIHSIKNNTATIGADSISNFAKELEFAAKQFNKEIIINKAPIFIEEFNSFINLVQEIFENNNLLTN